MMQCILCTSGYPGSTRVRALSAFPRLDTLDGIGALHVILRLDALDGIGALHVACAW